MWGERRAVVSECRTERGWCAYCYVGIYITSCGPSSKTVLKESLAALLMVCSRSCYYLPCGTAHIIKQLSAALPPTRWHCSRQRQRACCSRCRSRAQGLGAVHLPDTKPATRPAEDDGGLPSHCRQMRLLARAAQPSATSAEPGGYQAKERLTAPLLLTTQGPRGHQALVAALSCCCNPSMKITATVMSSVRVSFCGGGEKWTALAFMLSINRLHRCCALPQCSAAFQLAASEAGLPRRISTPPEARAHGLYTLVSMNN